MKWTKEELQDLEDKVRSSNQALSALAFFVLAVIFIGVVVCN